MIGQKELLNTIDRHVENLAVARFSIVVGSRGSGKLLIAKYISNKLNTNTVIIDDVSVDNLRSMIATSYGVDKPTTFIIRHADKMSLASKNVLLKITEEPPKNAYFIMTLCDLNNALDTIKSRAFIYHMDNYTYDELHTYIQSLQSLSENDIDTILGVADTPYEIEYLLNIDYKAFTDYVQTVVDNIDYVSGSNSFKIADKIALKNEEDKYDLLLFLKAFIRECSGRLKEDTRKYGKGIIITSKYLQDAQNISLNNQYTFDMWILDIRKEWM